MQKKKKKTKKQKRIASRLNVKHIEAINYCKGIKK